MSVEKNLAENEATNASSSEAVQVNPELSSEAPLENTDSSPTIESEETPPTPSDEQVKETESEITMGENTPEVEVPSETGEEVDTNSPISEDVEVPEEPVKTETPEDIASQEVATQASEETVETIEKSEPTDKEEEEEEEPEEEEIIDYTSLDKEALLTHITEIANNFTLKKAGDPTNQIRDAFNAIIRAEEKEALEKFIADGSKKEDFHFTPDNAKIKFDEQYKTIKNKRHHHYKDLEKSKEQNLKIKTELLEKLREIVDNEESSSMNALKKIQEEWKAAGPVQPQYNKTLWANYNALLDRFYDHRSIYFELKDLDRKKNLEAKLELCVKAEALDKEEQLNIAIKKLNDLHEEFKHLGPVPREEQEDLWQRFKAASDVVYSKRKEYTAELVIQLKANLVEKLVLVEELESFITFNSEKISEWNDKTKELLELQNKWEAIGGMPRENAKEINKAFWGNFKKFYQNKSAFFKSLDAQREGNLEIKLALIEKAEALKDNQEWDKTSNELIKLQNEWRDSGPVPEKHRNKVYKKFKAACDTFFNNRRSHNKGQEAEYVVNLTKKEAVCEQLEAIASSESLDAQKVYELQTEFNTLGFVPRKAIKKIQNRYKQAIQSLTASAKDLNKDDYDTFKSALVINNLRSGPNADKNIERQEYGLRRKITHLENDISTWNNNLGFFANSKNATELLKDFEQKIADAEANLKKLKAELRILNQA